MKFHGVSNFNENDKNFAAKVTMKVKIFREREKIVKKIPVTR